MAGRRYRYTWDHINGLSADFMARWGAFEPGHEARVGFDDEDEALLIDYAMLRDADAFTARYRMCRIRSGSRVVNVDERVILQRRPCRFGGHRVYFLCPWCRCATLRLAVLPEGLRCRHCGSVKQAPQRMIRRANKVAAMLQSGEWSNYPTEKPLHMRIAKFEALKAERQELADQIHERFDRRFLRSARMRRLLRIADRRDE
jgi:hypothetical protein